MKGRDGKEFHMDCEAYWGGKGFTVGRKYLTIYEIRRYNKTLWRIPLDEFTLDTLQVIKKTFKPNDVRRTLFVLNYNKGNNDIIYELANGRVDWS